MEALPSIALQEAGMPWIFDLKELLEENKNNPHFDLQDNIRRSVKEAEKKGATAILLYNSSSIDDGIKFNGKDRSETISLPVIYFTQEAAKKYFGDESAMLDIKFKTDITEKKR